MRQKNKVRPIEDYKASLVNVAITQSEGVTIHTIDHIAAMMAYWMRNGSVESDDGYKQVPLSTWTRIYLAVYMTQAQGQPRFSSKVHLPVGSIASVTAFLRVSLAIWNIGTSLLRLM